MSFETCEHCKINYEKYVAALDQVRDLENRIDDIERFLKTKLPDLLTQAFLG